MLISSNGGRPVTTDPQAPAGQELRQHARRALRTGAQLLVAGSPPFPVRALDISAGGMAVVASIRPPQGLTCMVLVTLPDPGRSPVAVELPATVVHSLFSGSEQGVKVGLSFRAMTPETAALVQRYVESGHSSPTEGSPARPARQTLPSSV